MTGTRGIVWDYVVLLVGSLLLSVAYALFLVPAKISNGGVISGIAVGLVFGRGASTGGTTIVSRLLKNVTGLSAGIAQLSVDAVVVGFTGLVFGPQLALYSLISLFVSGKAIDWTLEGFSGERVALIVSPQAAIISTRVTHELGRGVTILQGRGGYTGAERPVVMCVLDRAQEPMLRALVQTVDPTAFLVVTATTTVLGEGFEAHDVLARAARAFAATQGRLAGEGLFNLGSLAPEEAYPPSGATELLVLNTLPWARTVLAEEPEQRGGTASAGFLEMFFPRDVPWGGNRPATPLRRVQGEVPALGFAFLPPGGLSPILVPGAAMGRCERSGAGCDHGAARRALDAPGRDHHRALDGGVRPRGSDRDALGPE